MSDDELVRFAKSRRIDLVGIGAMTRMIAKAYRVADALRAAGFQVVMGGPHVTALPGEALGRSGGPRHADAVAVGESDRTWPRIVQDAERGELQQLYRSEDANGEPGRPPLDNYPRIPWEALDLAPFNRIPAPFGRTAEHFKVDWRTFHIIPIETGRGCPYGCESCTVTGFFGRSVRFRSNESVVDEMLRLKALAKRTGGQIAVFFVDDNLAINVNRTKSLLRAIIAAGAQLNWVGQISANLLHDEELVDLIAESGGKWIFIGMESIEPANLAVVSKSFNKPAEYGEVLERLARRRVYAITSFIFGLDHDRPGVADRTLQQIESWPPVLPVFGQLTPYPATPLYARLENECRLTRPDHWLDFEAFQMAHQPAAMSPEQVQAEVRRAWTKSYSAAATRRALHYLRKEPIPYRISHFAARLFFRGYLLSAVRYLGMAPRCWEER